MKSTPILRTALPLLAFFLAFGATAGLTLTAADTKADKKKAPVSSAQKKAAPANPTVAKSDENRPPLKISVDTKPINRDAPDRVSYAPVIKRTASSVVYVHSSKTVRGQDMSEFFNDPRFRRFFDVPGAPGGQDDEDGALRPNDPSQGQGRAPRIAPKGNNRKGGGSGNSRNRLPDQTQQGLGSGVVITADGYILTNNHVIEDADDVKVSIGESTKRFEAKVVGRDAFADIAVLKIEATGLSPAVFGDSDQLQVGDVVLAIGNPFGVGQSVSRGIVSALSRGVGIGPIEDFIQTDAAINPGNSGGALLDSDGRVVGINSAILSRTGGFAGVGFAIPINLARNIAEQLVNTGRVDRAFLGVAPQDITEELTAQFGAEKGAIISEVTAESPAEKAGLKAGDVITKVDTTEIRDSRHLLLTIGQLKPDSQVTIAYLREGKKATASARLGHRPEQAVAGVDAAPSGKEVGVLNGVGVGDISAEVRDQLQLSPRIKGALITSIEADSPSARQGLREGDIILELNRKPVTNAEQAVKLSEEIKGPKVLVLIWRSGRTRYLAIDEAKE